MYENLIEEFLAQKSYAVVGSFRNESKYAYKILKDLKQKGYNVVSKSQLICDLLMEGGVAIEAANILISEWYSGLL